MKYIFKNWFTCLLLLFILILIPTSTVSAATKLNKKKSTIDVGQTVNLQITGTKSKVTWSSSNKKIAKVSSKGKVTGVSAGKVTITAKVDKNTYKSTITVVDNRIEVVFNAYIMDDTSIEEYIATLQEENPAYDYSVYNDTHYSVKLSKAEYAALKKEMKKEIDTMVSEAINDPDTEGLVKSITFSDDYKTCVVTADDEILDSFASFSVMIQVYIISDIGQSIELVKPEVREFHITIISHETGDVLYEE